MSRKKFEEKMDFQSILGGGIAEIIDEKNLEKKLNSGKKLRIKFGVDPSSPDIHLGHSVILNKLKKFQEMGHKVIFLIGDYTAMIGDPSGKNKTRPILTSEEIDKNAKTYLSQVKKILDTKKAEIRRNSEWLSKLTFADLLGLASKFSVANIIERDDFEKRLKSNQSIGVHEMLYPLMQAYDSCELRADIEIGGSDQKFNMLAGRELQKKIGQTPQDVIMTSLLVGTDGKEKMSKSLGNYVGVSDKPAEMFGKIMSIPDSLIIEYFQLLTDCSEDKIKEFSKEMDSGKNPRDYKEKLAYDIVEIYHGEKEAEKSAESFIKQFRDKQIPDDIKTISLASISGITDLSEVVYFIKFAESKSAARRLIEQGAVTIDGTKFTDPKAKIGLHKGMIIQVGKRNILKLK